MDPFSHYQANKKETLAAGGKARTQFLFSALEKGCSLGKEVVSPTGAAVGSPPPHKQRDSRQPGERASTWPGRHYRKLAPQPILTINEPQPPS